MAVNTKTLEEYLIQVRRIADHREAGSEAKIRKMFAKLKKELTAFIGVEYAKYAEDDKLDFAILQKNREYARFLEEVIDKFDGITPEVQKEVQSLIEETYKTCYAGMVDGVQKCGEVSELREAFTSIKAISPAHVKAAVKNPVDKLTLKPTLERNRKNIISNIQREIGIGLNNGDRMSTMARRIQKYVDQDYRKSVLIARTEAHRVREVGFNDSAERIDQKLAENDSEYRLVKTWRTMQDGAVRHTNLANHRDMDDVSVLQDEDFILLGGAKAPCPGMSGIAAEDCNCRCYIERELMTDAEYFAKTGKHFSKKPFTNENKGDIIEVSKADIATKLTEDFRVLNPMDSKLYDKMKKGLERKGYTVIAVTSGDDLAYLKAFGAEAISDEHGIMHLGEVPSASAFYEEIIHLTQIEKYGIINSTDFVERTAREVAANKMLLRNAKAYKFTEYDIDEIKSNLEKWEEYFIREVGVSYEKSGIDRGI